MISNSKAYVEQRKPFEKFRNFIAFSPRSIVAENTPCAFSRASIGCFRNLACLFYSRTAKVFLIILRSLPPRSPNLGALCPFHPIPTTSTSVEGSSHEDSSFSIFFPRNRRGGVLFDLDRVSGVEKTTFLGNRLTRRGRAHKEGHVLRCHPNTEQSEQEEKEYRRRRRCA